MGLKGTLANISNVLILVMYFCYVVYILPHFFVFLLACIFSFSEYINHFSRLILVQQSVNY